MEARTLIKLLAAVLTAADQDVTADGEQSVARITINSIDLATNPDAWKDCHTVDVTAAGLTEILQLLGMQPQAGPADDRVLDIRNTPEDQAQFAAACKGLAAEMQDVFNDIDPRAMQQQVLDHRGVDLINAVQAVDDVFGDLADPLADEDDDR